MGDRIRAWNLRRGGIAPVPVFEAACIEAPIPDHDPVRDAHQLGIGEFHTGTGVAIVEQHIHAGGGERRVQFVCGTTWKGAIASGQMMPLAS